MNSTKKVKPATLFDRFFADVMASPEDWTLWSIFGDMVSDSGDQVLAECLWWVAANKKRPRPHPGKEWVWYDENQQSGILDVESDLPTNIFRHLSGFEEKSEWGDVGDLWGRKPYASFQDAVRALWVAWRMAKMETAKEIT